MFVSTMDLKLNRNRLLFFFVLLPVCFFSCKSFGPSEVQKENFPVDYSDYDSVESEKKRISSLLQTEPVEAYWRALLLNDEETISSCVATLRLLVKRSVEEKDMVSAWRYSFSLETTGRSFDDEFSFDSIDRKFRDSVPGFQKNEKEPESISDAIKATVTVLVDKGLVIKNGSGYMDKVLGSGFFIDKRGYIVTNHHVISDMVDSTYEGYSRLYIKLPGNEDDRIPAKVVGYDPVVDLALLKTEYEPEFVLSLGSSDDLKVGEKINVIGAPLGLEGSLTSGIVSNTKRKLFTTGDVFQIDAPVNSGNSGGPCIDKDNKVQAVVFAGVLQAQGLNFAIPVEYLKQELPFLYSGGEYHHGWTGCYGHTKRINGKRAGLEIQYVTPGTPSKLSGLEPGQVIVNANGKKINSMEQFQSVIRELTPGVIVKCRTRNNDDSENDFLVYVAKRPEYPALEIYNSDLIENSFLPLFGMSLSSSASYNTYKIENVVESSSAEEMQFAENDPVVVKKVKTDNENKYIIAQIITRRHKKNLVDVSMVLAASYDGPNYF